MGGDDWVSGYGEDRLQDLLEPLTPGEEDAIRRRIRAELIPWLLGHGDPIRDRIEAGDGSS